MNLNDYEWRRRVVKPARLYYYPHFHEISSLLLFLVPNCYLNKLITGIICLILSENEADGNR